MIPMFLISALVQTPEIIEGPIHPWVWIENGLRAGRQDDAQKRFAYAAESIAVGDWFFGQTPIHFRWLGHARLLSGDLASAIGAYSNGLAVDPANEQLHHALNYARDQVTYRSPEHRPAENLWPFWLSIRGFPILTFAAYSVGCLAFTRWFMVRRRGWLVLSIAAFAFAAVPAIGSAIEWRDRARDEAAPVLVLKADTPLRRGNGPDYPSKLEATLPRGQEVRRLFEKGDWLQVELPNGVVGWVPRVAVVAE